MSAGVRGWWRRFRAPAEGWDLSELDRLKTEIKAIRKRNHKERAAHRRRLIRERAS